MVASTYFAYGIFNGYEPSSSGYVTGGFRLLAGHFNNKMLFNRAVEKWNVNARQDLGMIKRQGGRFDYHDFLLASFEKDETAEM